MAGVIVRREESLSGTSRLSLEVVGKFKVSVEWDEAEKLAAAITAFRKAEPALLRKKRKKVRG